MFLHVKYLVALRYLRLAFAKFTYHKYFNVHGTININMFVH